MLRNGSLIHKSPDWIKETLALCLALLWTLCDFWATRIPDLPYSL